MSNNLRKTGKLLIEAAQQWETLIAVLKQPTGPSRSVKLPLPGEDEQLALDIFPAEGLIAFSFQPKRKRGIALPVAERSE